mmetsp:Transcript_124107/g.356440  ORF Transcript_124107/g.356440 Transcript_124107/m.356440 type:complete len:214 (-) Transcript_124107:878-1519(-)
MLRTSAMRSTWSNASSMLIRFSGTGASKLAINWRRSRSYFPKITYCSEAKRSHAVMRSFFHWSCRNDSRSLIPRPADFMATSSGLEPMHIAASNMPADQAWSLGPIGTPSSTSGGCHKGSPGSHSVLERTALQLKVKSPSLVRHTLPSPPSATSPREKMMFEGVTAPCNKPASSKSRRLRNTVIMIGMLSSAGTIMSFASILPLSTFLRLMDM